MSGPDVRVGDRFEIERVAGEGGMGIVYRARDSATGELVALKVLRGSSGQGTRRFLREARVLADLRHPAIVHYVAHGTTADDSPWLAMEWLEGEDVRARNIVGMTIGESLAMVKRAADGLALAHARGVVHRDVTPGNLFLVGGDPARVKVLDFGIARMDGTIGRTVTGVVLGTPGYMAPEQARGSETIDARADVFALGCVLFECVAGRPVFVAEHMVALLAKILFEDAPLLRTVRPDAPEALESLIASMLSKEPNGRPRDAAAVIEAIEALGTIDGERRPAEVPTQAITGGEQRLVSVIVASPPARATFENAGTVTPGELRFSVAPVRALAERFAARIEPLADGSFVAALSGKGTATDQAARAARCALSMRDALPAASIALATGRGIQTQGLPIGEAIERAVSMVRLRHDAAPGEVVIDEVTAGLLDARFVVRTREDVRVLEGEQETLEGTRTLLGKETPYVGRDREMLMLRGAYDECVEESVARVVVVTAAAGMGKTRLRQELLREISARASSPTILIGRADAMSAGAPFGVIASAVRRVASAVAGESLAVQRRKLRACVARHVAEPEIDCVTEFLGEIVGVPFPFEVSDTMLHAARSDPALMRDQIARAFVDFLEAETRAAPVILVVEDLHWGDLPSIALIDNALRVLRDRPLLVLSFARPEVHDLFPRLWQERDRLDLRIAELTRKQCERLVRAVLGDTIDDALVSATIERAEGNAFYLEELIRTLAEGKGDVLPGSVLAMVQSRLEALDGPARRVLRAASIFGRTFFREGVIALLGGARETTGCGEWLAELSAREIVGRRTPPTFPGQDEFAFRHALLREAAYAMLTDDDRTLGHRLAAEWLERIGDRRALVLAEHRERGDDRVRAAHWYRVAAEEAHDAADFASAVARADRGLACAPESDDRARLLIVVARASSVTGELARAEVSAREAMGVFPPESAAWYAAIAELATATGRQGNREGLRVLAATPFENVRDADVARAAIETTLRLAPQLRFLGEYEEGRRVLAVAEQMVARFEVKDPVLVSLLDQALSYDAIFAGDVGRNVALNESVRARLLAVQDHRRVAQNGTNLGAALVEVGAYDEAEAILTESIESCERLGVHYSATCSRNNLARVHFGRGNFEQSRALHASTIDTFRAYGDNRFLGGTHVFMARSLLGLGDLEAAEVAATEGARLLEPNPPAWAYACAVVGAVHLRKGDAVRALEWLERARAAALDRMAEGDAVLHLAWAEALHAIGRTADARSAIVAARDRLRARAATLANDAARERFLSAVPENARTMELAARDDAPTPR